jgi:hypothetical protein
LFKHPILFNGSEEYVMTKPAIEITSYTDPYCTWCWGSEPILRKIQEVYGEQVHLRFVMGGLVEDMRQFSGPGAGIGGKIGTNRLPNTGLRHQIVTRCR